MSMHALQEKIQEYKEKIIELKKKLSKAEKIITRQELICELSKYFAIFRMFYDKRKCEKCLRDIDRYISSISYYTEEIKNMEKLKNGKY